MAVRYLVEMGSIGVFVLADRPSRGQQLLWDVGEGPVAGQVGDEEFRVLPGAPLGFFLQGVPVLPMFLSVLEETDDGGALRGEPAVVVQHPLRHFPGLVRQTLPLAKLAGLFDELFPALLIEGDVVPGLLPLHHRLTLLEYSRPGQIVVAELVKPCRGGRDLPLFILQPVEMGLPCIRIFTHGAPALAHLPATHQPVGIAFQFGGRGELGPASHAGAVLQLRALVPKPGRRGIEREDFRLPLFACLCLVKDLLDRCQCPCRQVGRLGEVRGPLDEIAMAFGVERSCAVRRGPRRHLAAQRVEVEDRIVDRQEVGERPEAFGDRAAGLARTPAQRREQDLAVRRQTPQHLPPLRVVFQPGNRTLRGCGGRVQAAPPCVMRIEQPEKLHRRPVPLAAGAVIGEQPVHDLTCQGRQVRILGELPCAPDQLPVPRMCVRRCVGCEIDSGSAVVRHTGEMTKRSGPSLW